ncbi:MAG: hypothetical protein E7364_00885 [Clostridiales bacterium]|nr:hypothetical protein [Clostridiales bacterium]
MTRMKKFILGFAAVACIAFAGGVAANGNTVASAEETTAVEYTVVDTPMMLQINNEDVDNGKFNILITLPQTDYVGVSENFAVENLTSILQEFGFFDNVMVGEKTLKELGCTGLWKEALAYGTNEPQNLVRVHCHADPEIWKAAYSNGEVQFPQSTVSVKEGFCFPGYSYFTGAENPIVYRAAVAYESVSSIVAYSRETNGKTDVEDLKITQGWDGATAYVGVSLKGDDFLGDGTQLVGNSNHQYHYAPDYKETILINGQDDLVKYYGLYNLGEAGKGYYSFAITIPEEECETITIPKGTRFPARAMEDLTIINSPNTVFITYQTQTDMTFVKTEKGFMLLEEYKEVKIAEMNEYRQAKADADYFSADVANMNELLEDVKEEVASADSVSAVDVIFDAYTSTLDAILPKTDVIAAAKVDVENYKAEEGYFRAAEETQRLQYVATALSDIENAESKDALEDVISAVKAEIDKLKTAAQYADEELAPVKASANETIKTYLQDVVYLSEEKELFDAAKAVALQAVIDARTEEEIENAATTFKATVDVLTTKASYVEAAKNELNAYTVGVIDVELILSGAFESMELVDNKTDLDALVEEAKAAVDEKRNGSVQAAKDAINAKKASVIFDEYSLENQMRINELYKAAKDAIASAKTQDDLDSAVANFVAAIDGVEKLSKTKKESDKKEKGCGSIVGLSATVGLVAGACALLACKKKENER